MVLLHLLPAVVSLLLLLGHGFRDFGPIVLPFAGVLTLLLVHSRLGRAALPVRPLPRGPRRCDSPRDRPRARAPVPGRAVIRMAVILGATSLFTLFAAVLFESDALRRLYPRRPIL